MTAPAGSPLATPVPWDLVSAAYEDVVAPQLAHFAVDALREVPVTKGTRVLDVAAGPGTLALLAARAGATVTAVDFASEMVNRLRANIAKEPALAIDTHVADGMALPFADGSFDAAYSMFGLIFFPDRAGGFRELSRVLRPGGRAAVTSWVPFDRAPLMAAVFGALAARVPMPPNDGRAPLGDPHAFAREMREGGFEDVVVTEVTHGFDVSSADALWDTMQRSTAPIVLMQNRLGAAWAEIERGVRADLRTKLGDGPLRMNLIGNLGVGTRGASAPV